MLILGLTNRLPNNTALFFYEADNTPLETVLEEANFLSQVFDIDIYVLESSKGNYHLMSLDIIPASLVQRIQNWATIQGNYMTQDESPLYGRKEQYCVLRVGAKGKKQPPKFVKLFKSRSGNRPKSQQHYAFYRQCGIPEIPAIDLINLKAELSVYNSGIGAKPKHDPKMQALLP